MQDGERAVCSEDTKEEKEGNDGDEEKDEDQDSPVILLTAPTGRAASILKRRTGLKARTLHSVLGTARKSNPEEFIYDKVEILVVDECSLVPISILSEVLSTLLGYSLKKVIFLGDPHQLPSIDPGNFLKDIIKGMLFILSSMVKHVLVTTFIKRLPVYSGQLNWFPLGGNKC